MNQPVLSVDASQDVPPPRGDNVHWYGVVAVIVFLAFWEFAVRFGRVPELYLPRPTLILVTLYDMFARGGLIWDFLITFYRIFAGFAIGAVVGIGTGLLMGTSRKINAVGDVFLAAVYPIPKIALVPLLIIWLGTGNSFQIALSALGCFFPIVINTILGVQQCDPGLILAARDMDATDRQIKWKVILPSAIPSIFAGLRLALGVAIILVVAAEMITAKYGLGARLSAASQILETGQIFAILLLLAIFGVTISKTQNAIDRVVGRWRQ